MGKIVSFGKVWVIVHSRDHAPPHFHVKGPEVNALVRIDPITVLRGSMPSDLWSEIAAWAMSNRHLLVAEWNRNNPTIPTT